MDDDIKLLIGMILIVMSAFIGWFFSGYWVGVLPTVGGAIGGACIWSIKEEHDANR